MTPTITVPTLIEVIEWVQDYRDSLAADYDACADQAKDDGSGEMRLIIGRDVWELLDGKEAASRRGSGASIEVSPLDDDRKCRELAEELLENAKFRCPVYIED